MASIDHGVAGALGTELSMLLLYPLDLARTIRQVDPKREISERNRPFGPSIGTILDVLQERGLIGLYQGLLPTLQTLGISYFVYFYVYNFLKQLLCKRFGLQPNVGVDLCTSSIAGVTNVLMTSPLWVGSTRLKLKGSRSSEDLQACEKDRCLERPKQDRTPLASGWMSLWSEMITVAQREGLAALWGGCGSSLMLVLNPVLQFCVYDLIKRRVQRDGRITSAHALFAGALSKFIATILTYPLQVAQSRQRYRTMEVAENGSAAHSDRRNTLSELIAMFRQDGVAGLFAGMETKLLQTVLNSAILFLLYERIFHTIQIIKRRMVALRAD
eukprot:GEMP01049243.1.p1 GENE.GEMP01049243.1~~GEMP01049243.1.p1  ORF type:complete len:329 (+),score=47.72 GEMP01049243.1:262-1248(+)